MAKKFNVGVIGYGLSAKVFHIPFINLTEDLVLHSIVQRSPRPGNSAPADHPAVKHYTTTDALIQDTEVDIVVVTTPPDTHFGLARASLLKGKHVLVEKPFVPTAAEAQELADLARAQSRVLCVYQNRRWDSDFLTVRRLIADGTLGRIVEFETHFDRFRPNRPADWKGNLSIKQGGGVVYDLGTHLIDQAFALFGVPSAVSGFFVNQREGRFVTGEGGLEHEPDSFTAILRYKETGTLVQVRVGVLSVEDEQTRYWVRGTKASYHKSFLDPQEDQLRGGMKPSDTGFGVEDPSRAGTLCVAQEGGKVVRETYPTVQAETYSRFYELFAKSVASGKEEDVPVPAAQAAQVLRIIEAVRESAKTGQEISLT
ncbi:hypothetical protein VTK73DRAFT_5335 [Phialemonium thermophilum]|uniref:Oxidoreductase n=1 Tax=Phialemonium thermophilum TaxID=223376 RepID=A0ABR3Y7D0_9PEZI